MTLRAIVVVPVLQITDAKCPEIFNGRQETSFQKIIVNIEITTTILKEHFYYGTHLFSFKKFPNVTAPTRRNM